MNGSLWPCKVSLDRLLPLESSVIRRGLWPQIAVQHDSLFGLIRGAGWRRSRDHHLYLLDRFNRFGHGLGELFDLVTTVAVGRPSVAVCAFLSGCGEKFRGGHHDVLFSLLLSTLLVDAVSVPRKRFDRD